MARFKLMSHLQVKLPQDAQTWKTNEKRHLVSITSIANSIAGLFPIKTGQGQTNHVRFSKEKYGCLFRFFSNV